jgi:5-formyltetrahydrofolate cyclo-ligase
MQPDPAQPLVTPDVLLVPLLGFDRHGHRLGHGKGYYDRTLGALREGGAAPLAISLAFALQEVGEVPVGRSDQPLDAVVAERASHRWSPPPGRATAQAGPA